jgi:hypothetical protein
VRTSACGCITYILWRPPLLQALSQALPALVQAADLGDARTWAAWASGTMAGADAEVPAAVAARLSQLQQLIIVKCFRPDRWEPGCWHVRSRSCNTRGT